MNVPLTSFIIEGRLPGLNEMLAAANRNRFVGSKLKKEWTETCAQYAFVLKKFESPIFLNISWIEPNAKRDIDNVAAGIKYILDGLVLAGKIKNDTREWVRRINHYFPPPDKENPRIIISITETP
jgi:Holliday junction resolvase RusA-like endonuclease